MGINTVIRKRSGSARWAALALVAISVAALLVLSGCPETATETETAPAPTSSGGGSSDGVATISRGERVDLADHAIAGKITIFDFYSDYCPPCKAISPKLEELAARRDDIAVVKVDINRPGERGIDWRSPVAQQYSLQSIPHFIIYGTNGRVMDEGRAAREKISGWLDD